MSDTTFVRYDPSTRNFIPTTASDPNRLAVKADMPNGNLMKWAFFTAAGAVLGAWAVEALGKKKRR